MHEAPMKMHAILTMIKSESDAKRWHFAIELQRAENIQIQLTLKMKSIQITLDLKFLNDYLEDCNKMENYK